MRHVVHEGVFTFTMAERVPELTGIAGNHWAVKGTTDLPHPIADAEDGNAQLEDSRIGMRRAVGVHAGRTARQNQTLRLQFQNALSREIVPHHLAKDLLVANPAGDELGGLPSEIEDENPFLRLAGVFAEGMWLD